ncbi:MAG: PAS domain S-box protein [Desulfobulbaceae bacterium]|jgi:PAS domain S-box-containing protein|nr:PAS domain S-box protein [Desulfobulbaceae bacterium]
MSSFLQEKRREYAVFAAILVVVGLVAGLLLHESWRRKVENHFADEQAILETSYRASLQAYSMTINSYYYNSLTTDRVLTLLAEAYQATGPDGGLARRNLARGMLYRHLWRSYCRMRGEHILQLHFHTPDGRSFLRFHDPRHYNDDIFSTRPLIAACNRDGRPKQGFEIGRIRPGFRFVFPLHLGKLRLGTFDMTVTGGGFLKFMRQLDDRREYALLIRKDAARRDLFPGRMWIFKTSDLSDEYLIEESDAGLEDSVTPLSPEAVSLSHLLARRGDVRTILAEGREAIVAQDAGGALRIVSFLPIQDGFGKQVAYLISYGQDDMIAQYGREYFVIWLGAMLGALLIIVLFARLRLRSIALDDERRRLTAVNEALAEGVYVQDQKGRITDCNPACEQLLGFTKEEMIGEDAHDLLHRRASGDKMPRAECNLHRRFDVGQTYDGYEYFLTKDGRLLLVEISCRPIVASGRPMGAVCAFRDVTERKAMEEALRQSEEKSRRLARALDQSPASVMIIDRRKTIEYVNRKFTEVSGYQIEEAIGKHPADFRSGRIDQAIYDELWQTIEQGQEWHGELHSRRKNGETYWDATSVSPVRDGRGDITHHVAVKEDISERLRMERSLRDSEAFQRTLMESLPVGVMIIDKASRIIELANPCALRLIGAQASEVIGRRCHHFLCPDCEHSCPISDLGHEYDNSDRDLVRADGSRLPLMKNVRTLVIADEEKLLECFVDISERKRGEDALREANQQLTAAIEHAERLARDAENANQAKSNFLASMSHEIRTPMNAVLGMTHLALRTELTARQRDYLDKVDRSARALLGLLNEILDLSKVEAGKLELERIPFSLHEVLETMTTVIAARIGAKDIELAVGSDHDVPPWLLGDPLRLRQVLINLAGNAAKFTEEGEILVRARLAAREGDTVRVEFIVRDTGVGMNEEQKKAVFQPFTQANPSITRTFGGTGLGLSISQRLVELMGGEIIVESEPDKGSAFSFTIGFRVCDEPSGEPLISEAARALKVLIVDDREAARFLLSEYMRILGVEHLAVDSAQAAIAALKEADGQAGTAYNLALVDWRMPEMDGLQLVNKITGHPTLQPPPLVALISAFGREEVRQQAISAGCVDFLTKPISLQQLRDLLERLAVSGGKVGFSDTPTRREEEGVDVYFAGGLLLLVEDNLLNQQVAVGFLESAGFQVEVAANGVVAVRMAAARHYDGILMDIQMPEMDGYTATERIRLLPGYEKTPIIAVTAYVSSAAVEKMRAVGMDEHIAKPIDLRRLFSVLARWFTIVAAKDTARSLPEQTGDASGRPPGADNADNTAADLTVSEMVARLQGLLVVLRESRPKACAQALAALEVARWPMRCREKIDKIEQAASDYNFTQATSLTEALLRQLQGENHD